MFDLTEFVFKGDAAAVLDVIDDVYNRGCPIREFYSDLLDHFRNLLIVKMGQRVDKLVDLPGHEITRMQAIVESVSAAFLTAAFDLLFKSEAGIKFSEQPKLALELAFLRMLSVQPALPIDSLIQKLDDLRRGIQSRPADKLPAPPAGTAAAGAEDAQRAAVAPPAAPPEEARRPEPGDAPELLWKKLIEDVSRRHPSLAPHLEVSSLVELGEDRLRIEVNGNSYNSSMLSKKKNLRNLRQVAEDFFGRPMALDIMPRKKPAPSIRKKIDLEKEMKQAALNHPLVQDAVEIFGGQVAHVKILGQEEGNRQTNGHDGGAAPAGTPNGVVVPFRR